MQVHIPGTHFKPYANQVKNQDSFWEYNNTMLQVRITSGHGGRDRQDTDEEGWIKEWTLMLHGTREAPYDHLAAKDPHSKLAIVKKAHQEKKM